MQLPRVRHIQTSAQVPPGTSWISCVYKIDQKGETVKSRNLV